MPVPKRKQSKSRTRKRRSHDGIKVPSLAICPHCKELALPHRACPYCGFYKGKEVIPVVLEE